MATPTMAVIIILQCMDIVPEIPAINNIMFEYLCDLSTENWGYYTAAAIVWWISCLWITRYVWYPQADRLAMTDA